MDWRILVNFIPRFWLGINTNIRQSMLILPTHSGFHDLFLNYKIEMSEVFIWMISPYKIEWIDYLPL